MSSKRKGTSPESLHSDVGIDDVVGSLVGDDEYFGVGLLVGDDEGNDEGIDDNVGLLDGNDECIVIGLLDGGNVCDDVGDDDMVGSDETEGDTDGHVSPKLDEDSLEL